MKTILELAQALAEKLSQGAGQRHYADEEAWQRRLHELDITNKRHVRIATDHSDYFAWIQEHAAMVADLFEPLAFESPTSAGEGELVGTNFERKYRREGRPFHGLILRSRKDGAGATDGTDRPPL